MKWSNTINLGVASMLLFPTAAFAGFFGEDEDIIWKAGFNLYFKYADQDSDRFGKNDHPVSLEPADIRKALSTMEFTEKRFLSGEQIRSLFSVSQLDTLSKNLVIGLQKATPDQDIIFVMQGGRKKLILLDSKTFVAGRAFYQAGRLNIILGEYDRARNKAFESQYDPSGRGEVPYALNHGLRTRASRNFKGAVIGVEGVENKRLDGTPRSDWFVIDIERAAAYSKTKGETQTVTQSDKYLQLEAAKLSRERREMRAELARMRKEMKALSADSAAAQETPEERITVLKELLRKELITQEEFAQRRQEILDEI